MLEEEDFFNQFDGSPFKSLSFAYPELIGNNGSLIKFQMDIGKIVQM